MGPTQCSNAERVKMGAAPRDIAIEQVQTAPLQNVNLDGATSMTRDLRLSHAVKVLFFALKNSTVTAEQSNYTDSSPLITQVAPGAGQDASIELSPGADPILSTTLLYENTTRLDRMGSDYFSLVQPYYQCHTFTIPQVNTGYHMYSYSLDLLSLDPMGSTNYGKLTNISLTHEFTDTVTTNNPAQTFQAVATVVSNNVVRVSGGALGFPVL